MLIKSFLKNKKNFWFYTIFFLITIFIIDFIFIEKLFIRQKIESQIQNKIENRSFLVYNDAYDSYEELRKHLNIPHISSCYDYISYFYGYSEILQNTRFELGVDEFIPKPIFGKSFEQNSSNCIIIPHFIKMEDGMVDTTDLLGKNVLFHINYQGKEVVYNPVVIGIYDNEKEEETIYIAPQDIKYFDSSYKSLLLIIDQEKHRNLVEKELKKQGYHYNLYDDKANKELAFYTQFRDNITIFESFVFFLIGLEFLVFIYSFIKDQEFEIALRKAVGYSNGYLFCTMIKEILLYFFTLYFIGNLFGMITAVLLDLPFVLYLYDMFLISFFLLLEISILCVFFFRKIKKIQIINLLKSES